MTATGDSGTKALVLQGSTAGTGEFAGFISNGTTARIVGVTKAGTGTWTLSGVNTYTGVTSTYAGTLAVAATGTVSGSTSINITGGTTFDVSALPGGFTLNGTQLLTGGTGTNAGPIASVLVADTGSTVAPGLGAGNRGRLAVSSDFWLNSGAHLAVDLAGTVAGTGYDQLVITSANISLAGDLTGSTVAFTPSFADVFYVILNNGAGTTTGMLGGVGEGGPLFIGAPEFRISYTSDFGGAGFAIGGSGNDVAPLGHPRARQRHLTPRRAGRPAPPPQALGDHGRGNRSPSVRAEARAHGR